jgi:hypothetical protein
VGRDSLVPITYIYSPMEKRFTPSQDRFLTFLFDEQQVKVSILPRRLRNSAESLVKIGYVGEHRGKYRLTAAGQARAENLKLWNERPELRPKRGGVLKKGRISSPIHHGAGDD